MLVHTVQVNRIKVFISKKIEHDYMAFKECKEIGLHSSHGKIIHFASFDITAYLIKVLN